QDIPELVLGYFYYIEDAEAEALGDRRYAGLDLMLDSEIQNLIMADDIDPSQFRGLNPAGIVANNAMLAQHASHFGFFSNDADDSVTRWVVAARFFEGRLMPSLSLKMASNMLEREPVVFFNDLGIEDISLKNPEDDTDLVKIPM